MGRSPQPTREQTCPCPLGAGYSARPPAPRPGPSSHLVGGQRGAQKRGADSQARHSPQQGRAIRGCGSGTCLSYGLVLGGAGTGERAMVPGRGVANEGLGPGERVVREKRQEVQEVCGQSPSGPGWREWLRYRGGAGAAGSSHHRPGEAPGRRVAGAGRPCQSCLESADWLLPVEVPLRSERARARGEEAGSESDRVCRARCSVRPRGRGRPQQSPGQRRLSVGRRLEAMPLLGQDPGSTGSAGEARGTGQKGLWAEN